MKNNNDYGILSFDEASQRDVILELKNIKKHFLGVKALDGVDLELRKGVVTALIGENGAGKSTVLKTLFGIYKKTSGDIIFKGKLVEFRNPKEAMENGVAMVHQELNQVLATNVIDNVWLGRYPKFGPFVNKQKMIKDTNKIFQDLNIDVDPLDRIGLLPVSKRQMIEIAKAISYNLEVLILDEPTSSLTEIEVAGLFKIIKSLKEKGVSILFVSHKMSEIFQIADFVTVFRDGKFISNRHISQCFENQIVKDMVGRNLSEQYPIKNKINNNAKSKLKIENFSTKFSNLVQNVSFQVKEGEIFGISGLVGSGRTELAEMIFGKRTKKPSGKIYIDDEEKDIYNIKSAIKHGMAMITEERKINGIFEFLDVEFNTTIAQISYYKNAIGFLNKILMKTETKNTIQQLNIKTPNQKTLIGSLSGGNQQKVVFSRWLLKQPNIFIMDEPTRGIDVGAKHRIYELMHELSRLGKAIIIISSEMPELLGVCHRIGVMSNGKLSGILSEYQFSQEKIMRLASKYY